MQRKWRGWGNRYFYPLGIIFRVYLLLTVIKIFTSFRSWRLSRGASVVKAALTFQYTAVIMSLGFTFLLFDGYELVTYNAVGGAPLGLIVMGAVLIFRFGKINWRVYWEVLGPSIVKVALGLIICLSLFYGFDMPSRLSPYPPFKGIVTPPKRL